MMSTTHTSSPAVPLSGEYDFDVTSLVRKWYTQDWSNFGFQINDDTETNTNTWGTFYSSDASANVPELYIYDTYSTVTPYQYYPGKWGQGANSLTTCADNSAYSLFSDTLNATYQAWNGINSKVHVNSGIAQSSNYDAYDISYMGTTACPDTDWAVTHNMNINHQEDWNGTWRWSRIYINPRNPGLMMDVAFDLRKNVMLHELGHALGLEHIDRGSSNTSVAIMQQLTFYGYWLPTGQDQQTLNAMANAHY